MVLRHRRIYVLARKDQRSVPYPKSNWRNDCLSHSLSQEQLLQSDIVQYDATQVIGFRTEFCTSWYKNWIKTWVSRQVFQIISKIAPWLLPYFYFYCCYWPPLWYSGQSSWIQTQRSRVRFTALLDFLRSSGTGTGSTQPREYNWRAESWEYGRGDSFRWPHDSLCSRKLALSSPTSGGRSVGIIRSRIKATELLLLLLLTMKTTVVIKEKRLRQILRS
jgi:hypothetical protein